MVHDEEKCKNVINIFQDLAKDAKRIISSEDGECEVVDFITTLVDKAEKLGLI